MKTLALAFGLALTSHLALFVIPLDIRIGAPTGAANRRIISLALNSYTKPKPIIQPDTLAPPQIKKILRAKPKSPALPKPAPVPTPEKPMVVKSKARVDPEPDAKTPKPELPDRITSLPEKIKIEPEKKPLKNLDPEDPVAVTKLEAKDHEKPPSAPAFPISVSTSLTTAPVEKPPVIKAYPKYRQNPSPLYPNAARRRGYQGTVILDVRIDIEGKVEELKVSTSSGFPMLDRSAEDSVRKWRFVPGKRGEKTVEMWVQVPVKFVLR